ncbi:hypothetical protein CDAR_121261 [Caerostris darwini]|uniref:DM2 domain-containing protein n=1 Tax=Caerostris darwini TaxID=1538125 RepID=A0AAV4VGQ4_9ARAC|nr:hypothetical protein CDAR_121261 [Caerostris darwini]
MQFFLSVGSFVKSVDGYVELLNSVSDSIKMASKFAASKSSSDSLYSVLVSKDLMKVIGPVKNEDCEKCDLTTLGDVLDYVKKYIYKHQLFDPKNPVHICAQDDELGSVFGRSDFMLSEIKSILLEKLVFPVSQENSSEVICSINEKVLKKRNLENAPDYLAKRMKCFDKEYDRGSEETLLSIQEFEEDLISSSSISENGDFEFVGTGDYSGSVFTIAETFDVDVEYEVETDTTDFPSDSDSDSDFEDVVRSAILSFIAQSTESDIEYLADASSDDNMNSDQEISEKDKWHCEYCLAVNDPLISHCGSCWQKRRGWLSERTENHTKRKTRTRKKLKKMANADLINKDSSNPKFFEYPSGSQESLSSMSSSVCNDVTSQSLCENEKGSKNEELSSDKLCLFCCSKRADSSIIHGKVGCSVCCYSCGKKLQSQNQRCPLCRRTIERIVYLYGPNV